MVADLWEQLGEFNKNAQPSPAKGFVWDNAEVLNEVTACNNVVEKYRAGLSDRMLGFPETSYSPDESGTGCSRYQHPLSKLSRHSWMHGLQSRTKALQIIKIIVQT